MNKRIFGMLVLLVFIGPFMAGFSHCEEISNIIPTVLAKSNNQTPIRLTPRELKKSPEYKTSSLYERAHHLIYGDQAPAGPDNRVKIGVVVIGDGNIIVEDRIKNDIYQQLRNKFPRERYALMKGTDVTTKLLKRQEDIFYDHRATATEEGFKDGSYKKVVGKINVDVDGMEIKRNQPRSFADLRCDDYVEAGKQCGYDYVFVFNFTNGDAEVQNHYFVVYNSQTNLKQVWMRVRMIDVAQKGYLYRNDMIARGKTHNDYINGRIMERAVDSLMQEAMDDIDIQ